MNYQDWNDQLASHFFRPELSGRRIHLYVTEDLISEIGGPQGLRLEDFIREVKVGPPWVTRQGLCQRALQALRGWRDRHLSYPPYINYLALFVLAAGVEGDFPPHAYYPRLRELLGEEPTAGTYPSFHHMIDLWDDLERWSNGDKNSELGIFMADIAGSWIHVGLPIAQTLLTEHERRSLPSIFIKANLDPDFPPSDRELANLISKYGQQDLRPRTFGLLAATTRSEEEQREILIEVILEELRDWDGNDDAIAPVGLTSRSYGRLNLCCQLDAIAGVANVIFRCRISQEFPGDGFFLRSGGNSDPLYCEEFVLGWSTPISPEPGGVSIDAAAFDWSQGVHMEDTTQGWSFNLSPSPIRILVKGTAYGLPGLVEIQRLPRASPFYLMVQKEHRRLIEQWGDSGCRGFTEIRITEGLPESWTIFYADAAHSDELVRRDFPILALPSTVRLAFEGGIRAARGNRFFKFAPPQVVLEGASWNVEVYCNDTRLNGCNEQGFYEIPEEALTTKEVYIEARLNGERVRRLSLYLIDDFPWIDRNTQNRFGHFGESVADTDENSPSVNGALVIGTQSPPFDYSTIVAAHEDRRVFFIGREPGQIVNWPSEPHPTAWLPVWAIPMRQRGKAIFCGADVLKSEPRQSKCSDKRKLKGWKAILWYRRKRIAPPEQKNLRDLWDKYQEEARRV